MGRNFKAYESFFLIKKEDEAIFDIPKENMFFYIKMYLEIEFSEFVKTLCNTFIKKYNS